MGNPDIASRLAQANGLLKAGKVGVKILARGDRLYLEATLPPKSESTKPYPHQQRIALGYRYNPAGIDRAVRDARVLSARLIEKTFDWGDYGGVKTAIETMGDAINKFCEDYRHGRLSKGHDPAIVEQTLHSSFLKYLDRLDKSQPFSVGVLAKELEGMGHIATRRLKALAYANLADSVGVEHNLRELVGGYTYKSVTPKSIPTDDLIAEVYGKIKSKRWRTIYALMATYGLRNHEAFRLDFSDFPILFVEKGKTNERLVYPLYPEWADSWLGDNIVMPKVNLERTNLQLGRDVVTWFSRNNSIVPFNAYTLRHAWARRSMEFGWDLTLAAKQMGHSVKVHSDIYHAWLSQDVYDKAYQLILDNPDRPKPPQQNPTTNMD